MQDCPSSSNPVPTDFPDATKTDDPSPRLECEGNCMDNDDCDVSMTLKLNVAHCSGSTTTCTHILLLLSPLRTIQGDLVCFTQGGITSNNHASIPGCQGELDVSLLTGVCVRYIPENYLKRDGSPGSGGRCVGDCDKDNECDGNLVCFNRGAFFIGSEADVPGCCGTSKFTDYCVAPADYLLYHANDDALTVPGTNNSVSFDVLFNDQLQSVENEIFTNGTLIDGITLTGGSQIIGFVRSITTQPVNGTCTVTAQEDVTYTRGDADFVGEVECDYQACATSPDNIDDDTTTPFTIKNEGDVVCKIGTITVTVEDLVFNTTRLQQYSSRNTRQVCFETESLCQGQENIRQRPTPQEGNQH